MSDDGNPQPRYVCTACGCHWSYRAVRYLARCRTCGGTLVRVTDDAIGDALLAPAAQAFADFVVQRAGRLGRR